MPIRDKKKSINKMQEEENLQHSRLTKKPFKPVKVLRIMLDPRNQMRGIELGLQSAVEHTS